MIATQPAAPPSSAPYAGFGDIVTDPAGQATIRNMLGGTGITRWMQLFNPGHLAGGWDGPVELVTLLPGASCGEHQHLTNEEIYYIVSGAARMRINGRERQVTAGDLITAPMHTTHWIGVDQDAPAPMTFFVVEMSPARPPWKPHEVGQLNMPARMIDSQGFRDSDEYLRIATVDLTHYLTGPWGRFIQMEIPGDEGFGPYRPRTGTAEIMLILAGEAEITHGDDVDKLGPGAAIATVSLTSVRNASASQALQMMAVGVSS